MTNACRIVGAVVLSLIVVLTGCLADNKTRTTGLGACLTGEAARFSHLSGQSSRRSLTYVVATDAAGKPLGIAPIAVKTPLNQSLAGIELLEGYAYVDVTAWKQKSLCQMRMLRQDIEEDLVDAVFGFQPDYDFFGWYYPFVLTHRTVGGADATEIIVYTEEPSATQALVYYCNISTSKLYVTAVKKTTMGEQVAEGKPVEPADFALVTMYRETANDKWYLDSIEVYDMTATNLDDMVPVLEKAFDEACAAGMVPKGTMLQFEGIALGPCAD